MRDDNDGLLGPGAEFSQDRLASRDDRLPRVGVEGGCGRGLVREDGVDVGEVDLWEEGREGREAGADVAGVEGVFCFVCKGYC
jgi:hypothetical protein